MPGVRRCRDGGGRALDIDEANAAATAATLAEDFSVPTVGLRVDVGDTASVDTAADEVACVLGGCDVLCANVGVQQFGAIDRLTEDDWQWVVNVNVLGTVRTVASFLPLIREREGFRRIVLTASSARSSRVFGSPRTRRRRTP